MERPAIFLTVVGALIGIGIALSFYGSQIITEDLLTDQSDVEPGDSFEIFAELDPSIEETGVYVVQTMNFKENSINAKIYDPLGTQILSKPVESDSFEDRFEISEKGNFRFVIENSGDEKTTIVGVIGHLPDKSKLAVGITGFYVLIVGMIGIVGLVVWSIKNKRKNRFS